MSGISLVTKGFIHPVRSVVNGSGNGGGAGLVRKDEELPKPYIKVIKFNMKSEDKKALTEDVFKVKSLKLLVDQKD